MRPGDSSPQVRELQARLRQIAWFYGDVTDYYGDQTVTAVKGFQAKRGYPASGVVDHSAGTPLMSTGSSRACSGIPTLRPKSSSR